MSAAEFQLQFAEYCRNPWGELRSDAQSALIAALIHNTSVTKKEDVKQLTDFLLFGNQQKPAEVEEPDPLVFFGNM